MKYYGIVEGFFSRPLKMWSQKERINTINFIAQYAPQINSYFYCPKDDPFITQDWNQLYPINKLNKIKAVINLCKKNKLTYIFGLNPVIPSFEIIKKKLNQIKNLGCNSFCLLFDDLPIAYKVLDGKLNKQGIIEIKNSVRTCNKIFEWLKENNCSLWICSPDYCFQKRTALTDQLLRLDKEINFIWAGNFVFSKSITTSDLKRVKNILGKERKIIYWNNYPVNDCEQNLGTFNLGGFYKINPIVLSKIEGIFINPMREAYTNLPFYKTFSDYILNPKNYNRYQSWKNSLKFLLGKNYKDYLSLFKEFSQRNNTDNFPKFLAKYKIIKISACKVNNAWGQKFLSAIKPIFVFATKFTEIRRKIKKNKQVSLKEFKSFDVFPTMLNQTRYLPEIVRIVKLRLGLLNKKLKVSTQKAVIFEQTMFLKTINNVKIDPTKRMLLFSLRQNINRFTSKKSYIMMKKQIYD